MTRNHDGKRHWIALAGAAVLSIGFAVFAGPILSSEMTLLGFIAAMFGGYRLLNPRSRESLKFTIAMLMGACVLIGGVAAYGITVNDFGPAIGILAVTAIAAVATLRALDFTPYFGKHQADRAS